MKKIIIIDTVWTGHVPHFHMTICKALLDIGVAVRSISPRPSEARKWIHDESPIHEIKFSSIKINTPQANKPLAALSRITGYDLIKPYISLHKKNYAKKLWSNIADQVNTIKADHVFFPFIDFHLMAPGLSHKYIDKIFKVPWSCIYISPSSLRVKYPVLRGFSKLKPSFSGLKAKTCKNIYLLDEGSIPALQNKLPTKKIIAFPDFSSPPSTDERSIFSKEINLLAKKKKTVISFLGNVCKRKGIDAFINLIEHSKSLNKDWYFIIAGPLSISSTGSKKEYLRIHNKLQKLEGNFWLLPFQIPDKDLNHILSISDIVYCHYRKFPNSSNILTKAAFANKPVIASSEYCIGERVKKYNLGSCTKRSDPVNLSKAIESILLKNHTPNFNFHKQHSIHCLYSTLEAFINNKTSRHAALSRL